MFHCPPGRFIAPQPRNTMRRVSELEHETGVARWRRGLQGTWERTCGVLGVRGVSFMLGQALCRISSRSISCSRFSSRMRLSSRCAAIATQPPAPLSPQPSALSGGGEWEPTRNLLRSSSKHGKPSALIKTST